MGPWWRAFVVACCSTVVACGSGSDDHPVGASPARSREANRPTPPFRSAMRFGYRFVRAPVVAPDNGTYELFVRLNKMLPRKPGKYTLASATVDHVFGGTPLGKASGRDPCYHQTLDVSRYASRAPGTVKRGTPLVVRLYIGDHKTPLEGTVALGAPVGVDGGDSLERLGCRR